MKDHTPTTDVVRDAACFPRDRLGEPRGIDRAAFDRWLAEVRAEAWSDGYEDGRDDEFDRTVRGLVRPENPARNPYRQGEESA